ncbi:hypothetical protein [Kitasatospora sp. NPDC088779]|uniref:hypothetical protein n=1 Tax=unclassified Kitasatospora TaxID=2633591 RepID=UPI0034395DFF
MDAGEYDVGALAVEGQRVLEEYLHHAESGVQERVGQNRDAPLPGAHLGRAGLVAVLVNELVDETHEQ